MSMPAFLDPVALEPRAADAVKLLRALSNERRLMVLCRLGAGELCVGDLQQALGVSQSVLSQHLAVLRADGVVATRREGQTIFYRIADPAAGRVITTLMSIYCPESLPDAPDTH